MGLSTIPLLLTVTSSAVVNCGLQSPVPVPAAMEFFVYGPSTSNIAGSIMAGREKPGCASQRQLDLRQLLFPLQRHTHPIVLF